ncbi:DegT/DnrJ/EryC1/StrS family aminotransferase [Vulgatibacter incomptus]|uniref:Perosamine synthase n=1 Tax=Vulgatibacter incomptus TaxID=1391653 RepID=A0A0K1PB63_9BACT|nr:DegT/DnrJ/EryC1/StrS family aminotransferase [Vulgatibacter incomptus]AKU90661.1 Perosamine synthase [Vulgatibacter incomptus]
MDGKELLERKVSPAAQPRGIEPGERLFAPAIPSLSPWMLLPRRPRAAAPYPLDDPSVRFYYFARNGIYALARLWGLAGREILFPAYFHGVELEALLAAGVRPKFYPVGPRMQVDPAEVVARIGPDTRAIYLIHYVGFPGPVDELAEVCRERELLFVEDCALALLSCVGDRPLGTFGDAAIFCLYKTLPTPNGGAVVVRRGGPLGLPPGEQPPLASTLAPILGSLLEGAEVRGGAAGRLLRSSVRLAARSLTRPLRGHRVPTGTQHFDRAHVGLAMSHLSRVVIGSQDFARIVERRRRNYFHLLGKLRGIAPPIFGELPPGVCPLFYPLQVGDKASALARLRAKGVDAVDFWRVAHPAVPAGAFPEAESLRRTVLEIPCHQDLEPADVERISACVAKAVEDRR